MYNAFVKNRRVYYAIGFLLTLLFAFLQLYRLPLIDEHLESKTLDFRFRLRNALLPPSVPTDILIVAIDEKSIREVGGWPWGREVLASLVRKISADRPAVIGIDVILSEAKDNDDRLETELKRAGNVVLATPFFVPEGKGNTTPRVEVPDILWDSAFMQVRSQKGLKWQQFAIKPDRVLLPIERYAKVSTLGHVYSLPDMDGVIRWEVLYLQYGDDAYPSFSLQIARKALGVEMKDMVLYGGSGVGLGNRMIPTDLSGRMLINFVGKEGSFRSIPAADVLQGRAPAGLLTGKIVLIGTSALGTYDQKVTPFSGNTPGVEKNATSVSNILHGTYLTKSPGVIELVVIVLTGLFMGILLPRLKAVRSALLAVVCVSLYVAAGCYLLMYRNLWINLVYPIANMVSIFGIQTVIRFFYEEKKARDIRQMFSSYVSPKIVRELIENPEKARLGGDRRVVTVLFSDVIGFTSLSERRQPEEVVALLNEYFKKMTEIIFKWDGTLDKFVGDEIMVFWGAPATQEDHAERAVRCAIDMSERLDEMRQEWRQRGVEGLDCGIGINSGEVIIGNIGAAGKKMDYTVIGDNVNLAARVEKLTREYGSRILITENTLQHIQPLIAAGGIGHVEIRDLASVRVKGKEREVRICSVVGLKQP